MTRLISGLFVGLTLLVVTPALASEQSLLLVVSDFDAALQRPDQLPPQQVDDHLQQRQVQAELDQILDLLRRSPASQRSLGHAGISDR